MCVGEEYVQNQGCYSCFWFELLSEIRFVIVLLWGFFIDTFMYL